MLIRHINVARVAQHLEVFQMVATRDRVARTVERLDVVHLDLVAAAAGNAGVLVAAANRPACEAPNVVLLERSPALVGAPGGPFSLEFLPTPATATRLPFPGG